MFSVGIFKSNFKRFWILPAVITLIIFLVITFQMILELENRKQRYDDYYVVPINVQVEEVTQSNTLSNTTSINNITNTIEAYTPIVEETNKTTIDNEQTQRITRYLIRALYSEINIMIIFIVPIAISILLFSYINEEKSSSFIHGLPLSKKRLYITNILTGIAMCILPYLINLIILLVINLGDMGNYLQNVEIFKWFGICTLYSTLFFSFSTFIGSICASKISHGLLTYILMYAPVGMIVLLNQIIEKLLFGFYGIMGNIEELAMKLPFIKIVQIINEMSYYYENTTIDLKLSTIIVYILVTIIMLLLGYFLYKKRKVEVTKEFIAFDVIRGIIKYCATLCLTILSCSYFYYVFDEEKLPTIIGTLIITVIAYFIIEMILKKTYKVLKSTKGIIIYIIVIITLYSLVENGLFGFETKIPKIDEVKEVSITKYDEELVFDEKENILNIINMHTKIVEDKQEGYTPYIIEYTLKGGSKLSRKYKIRDKDYENYLNTMKNSEEYLEEKMKFLNEEEIEKIEIQLSYYTNSYKYSKYKTIEIEEDEKHEFIKSLKEDIKNRIAVFDNSLIESSIFKEEGNLMTIRVEIKINEKGVKYVNYSTQDIKDAKIRKYIQK